MSDTWVMPAGQVEVRMILPAVHQDALTRIEVPKGAVVLGVKVGGVEIPLPNAQGFSAHGTLTINRTVTSA